MYRDSRAAAARVPRLPSWDSPSPRFVLFNLLVCYVYVLNTYENNDNNNNNEYRYRYR